MFSQSDYGEINSIWGRDTKMNFKNLFKLFKSKAPLTKTAGETPPFETPIEKEKEEMEQFNLIIHLKNGRGRSYKQMHPVSAGMKPLECFMDFYKWFYLRESPAYTFYHKDGADIFLRSEIVLVSISKSSVEDEKLKQPEIGT